MEAEKYSPRWLLEKIKKSKTDAQKLIHIIDFQKNVSESTNKLLLSRVVITLKCGRCGSEDLKNHGYFYSCDSCLNIADHLKKTP